MVKRHFTGAVRDSSLKKIFILSLFFIALGNAILHAINVIMTGESLLLQWLPDDTFYYLNIAKHFSKQGIWTFDGGQTITTGFHLLWAYWLAFVAHLVGDNPVLLMQTVAGLSFTLALGIIAVVAITFIKRAAFLPLLVLAVFLSASSFLANSISGMEWSLAFAISVLYYYQLIYCPDNNLKLKLLGIFFLGIMGSLSRSEFGVLTLAYFSSAVLMVLLARQPRYLLPSGVGLVGATVGLLFMFLHNFYFSNEWLQGSSQIKFFWSEAFGHSPVPILLQISRIIFHVPVLKLDIQTGLGLVDYANDLLIIVGIILGIGSVLFVGRNKYLIIATLRTQPKSAFLFISAFLSVGYYLVVYSFNIFASQIWYTAFLTVPVFILVISGLTLLVRYILPQIVIAGLTVVLMINLGLFQWSVPFYQGQELGKSIGLTVKQIKSARIGISDAGIVSFYQGGTIINTDGLINNDIKAYLQAGRLECYLLDKQIEYTTGFGSSEQASIKRGVPIDWTTFSEWQVLTYNHFQVALRKVNFAQLAKLPKCRLEVTH